MTAVPQGRPVLDGYAAGTQDELLRLVDSPDASPLLDAIEAMGLAGLKARRADVRRLLRDDGVTYGWSDGAVPWLLDPLPLWFDAEEWARLEAGLDQRARLLDALFSDLVGDQRLLRDGTIPAGARVLVLDDILATGGTASAGADLVERAGGTVVGLAFLFEIPGLGGRERLAGREVRSLIV